jgi:hypothetical protein
MKRITWTKALTTTVMMFALLGIKPASAAVEVASSHVSSESMARDLVPLYMRDLPQYRDLVPLY